MEIGFLPLPSLAPVPKHRTKGRNVIPPLETVMIICNVQNLIRKISHKNNRIVHTGVGERRKPTFPSSPLPFCRDATAVWRLLILSTLLQHPPQGAIIVRWRQGLGCDTRKRQK